MGSFPENDALKSFQQISLGGAGYKVTRFTYADDEKGCRVEITWKHEANRGEVTFRFRGVVSKDLWPVRFATVEIENVSLRQWESARALQVGFGDLGVQFYASSVERVN